MALSGLDHFILARRNTENQHFLANLEGSVNDLQRQLASKTAAVEGYKALLDAILDAYEGGDYDAVSDLLDDSENRNAVYQPVFNSIYEKMTQGG